LPERDATVLRNSTGAAVTEPRKIIEELQIKQVIKVAPQTTVFRAFDPAREREVALKLLNPVGGGGTEAACEAFLSFAGRLQQLALGGVPEVLDFGFTPDNRAFLETGLVSGVGLMERAEAAPETVLRTLAAVARAAGTLADAGLVHHNLSSDNLLVAEDDPEIVWLLGLGSAAFLGAEGTGALLGHSPEWETFAAPESFEPELSGGKLGWPADLYSTALIACQVLGADVGSLGSPAPSVRLPAELRKALTGATDLERALSVALRRAPEERTLSLGLLAAALEGAGAAGGVVPAGVGGAAEGTTESSPADAGATMLMEIVPEDLPVADEGPIDEAEPAAGETPTVSLGPNDTHPAGKKPTEEHAAPPTQVMPLPELPARPPSVVPPGESPAVPEVALKAPSPPLQPPVPSRAPATAPEVAAKQAARPSDKAKKTGRRSPVPPMALAAAGGLLVMLAVIVVLFMRAGARGESPSQSMPVVVIEPTAVPVQPTPELVEEEGAAMDSRLVAARSALGAGDAAGARKALAELSPDDEASLSDDERAELEDIRAQLEGAGTEQAIGQLERGFRVGSIQSLRRGVDVLSELPAAEVRSRRGLADQLAKARRVLQAHTLMWRARKAGDHLQVLERSGTLMELAPKYSGSIKLREEAASAVEKDAEAALGRREFNRAIGLLNAEQRYWPSRKGLAERIARVKAAAEKEGRLAAALNRAAAALAASRPEEGLNALGAVRPDASYAVRFADMKNHLQQKLEEMDAQPPKVSIEGDVRLRYRKNEPLKIPLTVTDDYRVEQVKVMMRTKAKPAYRALTLKAKTSSQFVFDLTPALHQNETVEFYVIATDRSGHTGLLGSPSQPLEVTRKKWYQR